jgi:hypothetical protein
VVYQFLEGLSVAAHLPFEFGVHIVIESESRSHILMLAWRHQDAQTARRVCVRVRMSWLLDTILIVWPIEICATSSARWKRIAS